MAEVVAGDRTFRRLDRCWLWATTQLGIAYADPASCNGASERLGVDEVDVRHLSSVALDSHAKDLPRRSTTAPSPASQAAAPQSGPARSLASSPPALLCLVVSNCAGSWPSCPLELVANDRPEVTAGHYFNTVFLALLRVAGDVVRVRRHTDIDLLGHSWPRLTACPRARRGTPTPRHRSPVMPVGCDSRDPATCRIPPSPDCPQRLMSVMASLIDHLTITIEDPTGYPRLRCELMPLNTADAASALAAAIAQRRIGGTLAFTTCGNVSRRCDNRSRHRDRREAVRYGAPPERWNPRGSAGRPIPPRADR
jgi:hypothetical protein